MNDEFRSLVKKAKNNELEMLAVIDKMKPLINSYRKRIFFMDNEDAEQELYLTVIKAIRSIKNCDNNGQCFTYIANALKIKYINLCKDNIYKKKYELSSEILIDKSSSFDTLSNIDLKLDVLNRINNLSMKQQQILNYLLLEYTDTEIAEELHVSRQYINRVKKVICKKISINI